VIALDEAATRAALARDEVLIGTALAQKTGIAPGDEIAIEVSGRTTKARVAALAVDFTSGGVAVLLSRDSARRLFGLEAIEVLLVTAEPGKAASLQEPLEELAAEHGMLARSFAEMQSLIDRVVQGIVGSLESILLLGFVVGSLGVANTVTMNVLEKARTLGLLRSVGMTSRQVTRMVVLQSVLLGTAGGLIGVVGGITTALFIQISSQPLLGHPVQMSLRPWLIVGNLAAAVLVTAAAAWLPARRAARIDLLQAISTE
jgi:putative ABC transport system permease protein